jgi:hypothetical protein
MRLEMKVALILLIISFFSTATLLLNSAHAQENQTRAVNSKSSEFIPIQHAQSGLSAQINATTRTLELNNISDKTILLSDRPERIVTSISTRDFIHNWSNGEDSFKVDPPNAVLVLHSSIGQQSEPIIMQLFNPSYDLDKKSLKYDVMQVNATAFYLPTQFGQATLVIDLERHTVTKYPTD